jgi:hypothetical protein
MHQLLQNLATGLVNKHAGFTSAFAVVLDPPVSVVADTARLTYDQVGLGQAMVKL